MRINRAKFSLKVCYSYVTNKPKTANPCEQFKSVQSLEVAGFVTNAKPL